MKYQNSDTGISQTCLTRPAEPHVGVFIFAIVALVMLTGIDHPYLWSPDEPREAEIARETLVDGHWITPHLCGLPFLEKPPLFYDIIASAYALTGSISPTVARCVPVLFGGIMLAAVFVFCRRWAGPRAAWLSVLILLAMPKFYLYSHLILLDIAVGAFCTIAIAAFAFWLWWPVSERQENGLLCLFYLASAGAFMSKGVAGIFHVIVIVGAFCLVTWRWQTLRKLILAWPIVVFIVPVAAWVYLFYREGGMPYLHEHFINNIIGRFLRVQFVLPNVRFYHTDLGKKGCWYFYLGNLPAVLGATIVLLPLAIWNAAVKIRARASHYTSNKQSQGDMWLLLLIWVIVPIFLLSFSAAKEISYIIPSYSAIAILIAVWLDESLTGLKAGRWLGIGWLSVAAMIALLSILLSDLDARTYLVITLSFVFVAGLALVFLLYRKCFSHACFLFIAIAICAGIINRSPNVQHEFRGYHCALPLARHVWTQVGDTPLYLYKPKDMLRGSICFYGNRTVAELDTPEQLNVILTSGQRASILMEDGKVKITPETMPPDVYTTQILPDFGLNSRYILLAHNKDTFSRR